MTIHFSAKRCLYILCILVLASFSQITLSNDSTSEITWDLDGNNKADALTDGMLLIRYTFGLRGASLTDGAIALDSPFSDLEVE